MPKTAVSRHVYFLSVGESHLPFSTAGSEQKDSGSAGEGGF